MLRLYRIYLQQDIAGILRIYNEILFQRGVVCIAAPYGHMVWRDTNDVCYDIYGVSIDFIVDIPAEELGEHLSDFRHIPGDLLTTDETLCDSLMLRYGYVKVDGKWVDLKSSNAIKVCNDNYTKIVSMFPNILESVPVYSDDGFFKLLERFSKLQYSLLSCYVHGIPITDVPSACGISRDDFALQFGTIRYMLLNCLRSILELDELFSIHDLDNVPIDSWEFADRTKAALYGARIYNLGDLLCKTEEDIRSSYGVGDATYKDIKRVLSSHGIYHK